MKKFLSLFAAILFVGSMFAADQTLKSGFDNKCSTEGNAVTDTAGVVTWSIATEVGAGTPTITGGTASSITCLKFGSSGSNYFKKIEFSTEYFKYDKVKSVKLYIRNNGKKTGTFTAIQGEVEIGSESKEFGAEWVELTATGTAGTGGTLTLTYEVAQASYWSYIEVTYEPGDAPACTKTVTITKGAEENGTFSLSATEVCGDGEGEAVSVLAIVPAEGYEFGEITTSASGTVDNENKKVTGITESTTIGVVFNEIPKYTVSFNTGAGNDPVEAIKEEVGGQGITLPAGPIPACAADGWSFVGWAEAAVAAQTSEKPALLFAEANYKPASDVTLYAVYKKVVEAGDVQELSKTEDFEQQAAGSTYNSTQTYDVDHSSAELAWTMYYGTVSTNDKVAGAQSAQMRWYASATDALGYIQTTTPVSGLQSLNFKARVSNTAVKMSAWYSTDGENWTICTDNATFSEAGKGLDFESTINGTVGTDYYIKIGVGDGGTAPGTSSYKLIIDDIQFNYKAVASTTYYLSAPSCEAEDTWTVAGSSTVAFGTSWDAANAANDMVLDGDVYKWEKTNLELAAGSVDFKVVKNHAWGEAYPASNYNLAIAEAGIYTISITFNPESKEVAAVATKTGEAVVVPTIILHGNFSGEWQDTEAFVKAGDSKTASLTMNIAASGNYEFGVKIDGTWTANGQWFTRALPEHAVVAGSGNLTLVAGSAGEYTFTWTYETNTLTVTFPTPQAKLNGSWDEWGAQELLAGDETSVSIVKNLAAGDYEFKLLVDGSWLGYGEEEVFATITRENVSAVLSGSGSNNVKLTADQDGEYTFTWTFASNTVDVAFPAEPVVPGDSSYVKVTAAPVNWAGEYLIVYETANVAFNGGLATLDAAGDTIAVVINEGKIAADSKTNAAKFTFAAAEGGYTIQSASGFYIGVGSYSNGLKQTEDASKYIHNALSIDEEGNAVIAIYNAEWNTTGGSMILNYNSNKSDNRFRYYKEGSQKKIQLYKKEKNTATAIDNIEAGEKAFKVVRDGQILIIKGENIFTIMGQRVK